jgi:hypothetical protein
MGQVFSFLETTDDARWPGHKLCENTYVIFTSDNGGSINYTDNTPLDLGKTSAKEGGTRVPLFIAGPGIPAGVQTDVIANGLDFYPTILSLTGSKCPESKNLEGCDLAPLLLGNPTDATLVKHPDGSVRDTMMWHFPHGRARESTIRVGDYKLIRNYDHVGDEDTPHLELFHLYKNEQKRADIEEARNQADMMPEKTRELNQKLSELLIEMDASYPAYNPDFRLELPNKESVPVVTGIQEQDGKIRVSYRENGAGVRRAHLIYTLNGGEEDEEWSRAPMELAGESSFTVKAPEGTTHYFINLIDQNQFLVSHPSLKGFKRGKTPYTQFALQPMR